MFHRSCRAGGLPPPLCMYSRNQVSKAATGLCIFCATPSRSPRSRRLFAMIEWAMAFSDPDGLRAYIDALDPAAWRREAAHTGEAAAAQEHRRVADLLELADRHDRLVRILRVLEHDLLDLERELAVCRAAAPRTSALIAAPDAEARSNLRLLPAIKPSLIHR